MHRTTAKLLATVLLHGVATPALFAQAPTLEEQVDSIFADVSKATAPGCAVSVMRQGAPVYERGYGMANLEYGIPITPRSVFHVASVSKQFTAMAVELLVNEGKVSWDDDIRTYVPEVPSFGRTITLRHLAHHTSGIRDQWNLLSMAGWRWEADVVTQKDVLDITSRQEAPNFEPGERYLYSNTGFTLLAVVVERVSGQTLRQFTADRIFGPLGMEATHFHDDHEMIVRNRAWAYAPDSDGAFGLKSSIPDFDVVGATSLFTTAHDMAAWDRNFHTGQVGGTAALARMREPFELNDGEVSTYGHGLDVGSYRGLRTEGHGGADAGYRSQFLRFPDQELGIAVLCNSPSANPGARARDVAQVYLSEEMQAEDEESDELAAETVPTSPEQLARLVGVYRGDTPGQILIARMEGDELQIQGTTLRPLGQNRFEVVEGGFVATFTTLDDGQGLAIEWPAGRVERIGAAWEPTGADLGEFAGTYVSSELGTDYRLAVEDEELWFHHRKLDSQRLVPLVRDEVRLGGRVFQFTRDARGAVDGFTLSDGRVWGVQFERVED